jgi:hypothetical protein
MQKRANYVRGTPSFAQAEQTGKAESTKDLTRCDYLGASWAQDPRVMGVERWISSSRGAEPIMDGHLLSHGRRWHLAQHDCMKRTPSLHQGPLLDPATRYRSRRPSLADGCRATADGPPPNTPAGEPVGEERGGSPTRALGRGGDWRAATAHAALPATRASVRACQGTVESRPPATKHAKAAARAGHGQRWACESLEESECQDVDATLLRTLRVGGGRNRAPSREGPAVAGTRLGGKKEVREGVFSKGCVVDRGTTRDSADPDDPNDPDPRCCKSIQVLPWALSLLCQKREGARSVWSGTTSR